MVRNSENTIRQSSGITFLSVEIFVVRSSFVYDNVSLSLSLSLSLHIANPLVAVTDEVQILDLVKC